jgi:hypothetical protein
MTESETLINISRFEYGGFKETVLDQKIDRIKNQNIKGSILFTQKPLKKSRPFKWSRIRSFFIMHKKFKRLVEFSIHPTGIHMMRLAVFYSESGCKMCKVYVEKNLF